MKTAAGALIIAIVLVLGGLVALSQARLMRQTMAEQQRLATLHYDDEGVVNSPTLTVLNRLSLPFLSNTAGDTQRASLNYWQARYQALTPLTGASGDRQSNDPTVLLIAANAAFRASQPDFGNPKVAVERLDTVQQAYGDVLRADPTSVDAAYNYEYVSRVRDAVAKGRVYGPKELKEPKQPDLSDDLPVGPTLHGRPGGPPPEVAMKDFKTFSPLQTDERGEQIEQSRTPVTRKKG